MKPQRLIYSTITSICLFTTSCVNNTETRQDATPTLAPPQVSITITTAEPNVLPQPTRKTITQSITPTMLNYSEMHEGGSMYNTPPTFAWYVAGKIFKWLKKNNIRNYKKNISYCKSTSIENPMPTIANNFFKEFCFINN